MADISFAICVVDEDGDPVEGIEVSVHYSTTYSEEYTDENGWAHFEKHVMTGNGVRTTVYVDGENMGNPWFDDGDTQTFVRP